MHKYLKTRQTNIALLTALLLAPLAATHASDFHVATTGSDVNPGTKESPFRTVQHAADLAQPGDVITVHEGVYRERISPPRGGTSDANRIVYQAAPGEKVVITGAEPANGWVKVTNDTWQVVIPNSFFSAFNPYNDRIHGDWCSNPRGFHTGAVYLGDGWLTETEKQDKVLQIAGITALWFASVDATNTTIWAQFKGVNPNETNVEINVRQTVFTPSQTGINYLTVRGFELRAAASPWAPPTAGQIGIISAYWCKGWIIESNNICYSPCCGVALGKYSDEWDNRAESAEGYVGTLRRALTNGWNKATVGSHLVRNNHIHHCDQAGVVGSLGCSFSAVTGNVIHDIHLHNRFGGAEMAGIKFHGAIDVTISHNHIYRCGDVSGIWLDWMGQGAQVTGNLLHDNSGSHGDIFLEMQHGPILIANNLILSSRFSLSINSSSIRCVHNLITGSIWSFHDSRKTPWQVAHGTDIAGIGIAPSGDHGFYNNIFIAPCNLRALDGTMLPCFAAGNVFTKGTQPSKSDTNALLKPDFDAGVKLVEKTDGWYLTLAEDKSWRNEAKCKLVTTELLGKAKAPDCAFENADGSPLRINTDYFGKKRDEKNPMPGPFESPGTGLLSTKVW